MKLSPRPNATVFIALAGLAACTALAGCGKPSIVGLWSGSIPMMGKSMPATIEYKADGTDIATITAGQATVVAQGTYTVKDDTLTQTVTGVEIAGHKFPAPAHSDNATFKIDGDTLTVTAQAPPAGAVAAGGPTTYSLTRVKK